MCVSVSVRDFSPSAYKDAWHLQILRANNLDALPSRALVLFLSSFEQSKPIVCMSSFPTFLLAWKPDFYPSASETALYLWF